MASRRPIVGVRADTAHIYVSRGVWRGGAPAGRRERARPTRAPSSRPTGVPAGGKEVGGRGWRPLRLVGALSWCRIGKSSTVPSLNSQYVRLHRRQGERPCRLSRGMRAWGRHAWDTIRRRTHRRLPVDTEGWRSCRPSFREGLGRGPVGASRATRGSGASRTIFRFRT